MALSQFVRNCWLWLVILVAAILVAVWLHPDLPEQDRSSITSYYFALLAIVWAGMSIWRSYMVWRLSTPTYLEFTADNLWNSNPLKQRDAMQLLSLVLGARFGTPIFPFGRKHAERCRRWQEWWERNHELLAWEPTLRVYSVVNPRD